MPLHGVGNDLRREWSTVNSNFACSQPLKGSQGLPYSLDLHGRTIGSGIYNADSEAYITQLHMDGIQTSPNGVTNKGVDLFPDSNDPMEVQSPGIPPSIGPVDYRRIFSADWSLPLTGNCDQFHDRGNQPDVRHLTDGYPEFGATASQESNDTLGTTFPFSMTNEEFAQSMVLYSESLHSLGPIAQPQPGNEEPYPDPGLWAPPVIPYSSNDVGTGIPTTPYYFGDGYPVETLPRCEPPSLIVSTPNFSDRTRPSPVPTQVDKPARDLEKDCKRPMIQTLNLQMVPTEPRKRRCFSKSEKERIKEVRKVGACSLCHKQRKKCWHVALSPEESHAASPDSNGPETPVSDLMENVQILSPSQGVDRDN